MDVQITCVCPPKADGQTRHPDGDTVTLRERLGFRGASAARWAGALSRQANPAGSTAEYLAALSEEYVVGGVESWTLVDSKNKPVEVSPASIRAFMEAHTDDAMTVGDAADDLYSAAVLGPLATRASQSSPPSPTAQSTSAPTDSPQRSPRPSRRSSTSTTRTDGIATITPSPAGVSSS